MLSLHLYNINYSLQLKVASTVFSDISFECHCRTVQGAQTPVIPFPSGFQEVRCRSNLRSIRFLTFFLFREEKEVKELSCLLLFFSQSTLHRPRLQSSVLQNQNPSINSLFAKEVDTTSSRICDRTSVDHYQGEELSTRWSKWKSTKPRRRRKKMCPAHLLEFRCPKLPCAELVPELWVLESVPRYSPVI